MDGFIDRIGEFVYILFVYVFPGVMAVNIARDADYVGEKLTRWQLSMRASLGSAIIYFILYVGYCLLPSIMGSLFFRYITSGTFRSMVFRLILVSVWDWFAGSVVAWLVLAYNKLPAAPTD